MAHTTPSTATRKRATGARSRPAATTAPPKGHKPGQRPASPAQAAAPAAASPEPSVNTDLFARNIERYAMAAIARALHRAIPLAMRDAVDATLAQPTLNDANLVAGTPEKQVMRNGVTCPRHGTVIGSLWLLFGKAGAGVTLAQARQLAREAGLSETTAAIQLYNWRKFHNVKNPRSK